MDKNNYKILLIRPYFEMQRNELGFLPFEPLGLQYLQAVLFAAGYQAEIYDCLIAKPYRVEFLKSKNLYHCGASITDVLKRIKKFQPDIVGLSGMFYSQKNSFYDLADAIKKHYPQIFILGGGAFPSSYQEEIFNENKSFDAIAVGEGEQTIVELLENFSQPESVKGLWLKNKSDNSVFFTGVRPPLFQLDQLPLPARRYDRIYDYSKNVGFYYSDKFNFINLAKQVIFYGGLSLPLIRGLLAKVMNYRNDSKPKATLLPLGFIVTSRGCPQRCTFCAIHKVWGQNYRIRPAASVLSEINQLASHGAKEIVIVDDNFTVSKKRTIEICQGIIAKNHNLRLMTPSGVYLTSLDEETLDYLYRAGLRELIFGIENGDQKFLNTVIKKNLDLEQAKSLIALAKKIGLKTKCFLIFGYPGETKDTMIKTLRFGFESGVDSARFYIFQPFPNTEAYQMAKGMGALNPGFDLSHLKVRTDVPQINTPEFNSQEVKRIFDLANSLKSGQEYNKIKDDLWGALGWTKPLESK